MAHIKFCVIKLNWIQGPYDSYGMSYNDHQDGSYNGKSYHQTPYAYAESYGRYWI